MTIVKQAPGLRRFGEQPDVDALIRKYGYSGTENVLRLWKTEPVLQDLTHGTAHLITGPPKDDSGSLTPPVI